MGYTHYWTVHRQATPEEWTTLLKQTKRAISLAKKEGIQLGDWNGEKSPVLNEAKICFNGKAPDDYETFLLEPTPSEFEFCKTGRNAYDTAVVAVLELAKNLGFLTWRSDGEAEDHVEGLKLCAQASKAY